MEPYGWIPHCWIKRNDKQTHIHSSTPIVSVIYQCSPFLLPQPLTTRFSTEHHNCNPKMESLMTGFNRFPHMIVKFNGNFSPKSQIQIQKKSPLNPNSKTQILNQIWTPTDTRNKFPTKMNKQNDCKLQFNEHPNSNDSELAKKKPLKFAYLDQNFNTKQY